MKTISPSWNQAFEYAFASGYALLLAVGLLFVLLAIVYSVARNKMANILGNGFFFNQPNIVVFILLALAMTFTLIKPVKIKTDNEYPIAAETLKHYQSKGDNLNSLWDSVYNNNLMIGAAKK